MADVAVVGLGAMGGRIARRLAASGHRVLGWNRTRERAAGLGIELAATPADAARRARVLMTMVADPGALRSVVEGDDGVAAGAHDSLTVVEMSTIGPAAVAWLRGALPSHTDLLDAPVLGSLSEVEAGTLAIFAGGSAEAVDRCRPLLTDLGEVVHVGELGSGAAAKLVANTTLLGVLGVLGEALALGERLGLRRDAVFSVLGRTPLAAQAERRRPVVEGGEVPRRFALGLARKDAELIATAAPQLPIAAAVRDLFTAADADGWGDRDYSALVAWLLAREPAPSGPSL